MDEGECMNYLLAIKRAADKCRSLVYTHECKGADDSCTILTRTRTLSEDVASRLRRSSRKEKPKKIARILRGICTVTHLWIGIWRGMERYQLWLRIQILPQIGD